MVNLPWVTPLKKTDSLSQSLSVVNSMIIVLGRGLHSYLPSAMLRFVWLELEAMTVTESRVHLSHCVSRLLFPVRYPPFWLFKSSTPSPMKILEPCGEGCDLGIPFRNEQSPFSLLCTLASCRTLFVAICYKK